MNIEAGIIKKRRTTKYKSAAFWGRTLWTVVRFIILMGLCFMILYPLIIKVATCFMSFEDLNNPTVKLFPREGSFVILKQAASGMNFWSTMKNTLILSLAVSIVQLLISSIAGYGLARFKFKGRKVMFAAIVVTLLIPPQTLTVPLFVQFSRFGIINTYWPFVLLSFTGMGLKNGLYIYMMRQFFFGMPRELEQMETDEVTYQPKDGITVLKPQTQIKLSSAILNKLNILELSGRKKAQNVFNQNTVVMFAGDSVTDSYRDTRIFPGMNTGKGHATNISAYLDAVYGNVTVLNAGVSGASSSSMLSRFHDDVLDFEPDYLIMMIGINDAYSLWVGEATDIGAVRQAYEANLREMLTASAGIKKVLMITPYYVEEKATSGKRKEFVDHIQEIAKKVSAEFDNVMMLDIQEVFDQKIKEITFSAISLDRVHLTPYGYQILTAEVLNKLGW